MTDMVTNARDAADRQRMHAVYRAGGMARQMARHVVYAQAVCPWSGCDCPMQAIDFRLEEHGKGIHDHLVKAWWDDTGFAGKCPQCSRWIHFTIREKQPIDEAAAAPLPQLPANWYAKAVVL